MSSDLPALSWSSFRERLAAAAPVAVAAEAARAMHAHYEELARWNRRLSLIGPGTRDRVVERHFAESLYGLELLPSEPGCAVIDVGSGGGFPGFPLRAARPDLRLTLIESRQRKWAYLKSVSRSAALPCRCVNARVGRALPREIPAGFQVVVARAVNLAAAEWEVLLARGGDAAAAILWLGADAPDLPESWEVVAERPVLGSEERRVVKFCNNNIRNGAQ